MHNIVMSRSVLRSAKTVFIAFLLATTAFVSAQTTSTRPVCTSLSAQKIGINKIKLTWKIPDSFKAASVAVFRSNEPITLKSTISAERPVAEVPAKLTTYTDTLKKFGEYYYAVIARDKDGNLFNMLFPTVNATAKAVVLEPPNGFYDIESTPEEQYVPGFLRELPLPYLDLISDLDIPPTQMSAKATNSGYELAGEYAVKKLKPLPPYVFEDDFVCATGGDDFYLFESLKNYFIKKDYKGSVTDLRKLLSVKRSPEVTTRAVFYLAESQYYCKNYRHALELFLFLEDDVPELAKKWIDSTLDFYQIPTN